MTLISQLLSVPILGSLIDNLLLSAVFLIRCGSGGFVGGGLEKCKRPTKTLVVYEHESDPGCRKVREILSVLDLDVLVKPFRNTLPKLIEDNRFRNEVYVLGGHSVPFLVDENTEFRNGDADTIVKYLISEYGSMATMPWSYVIGNYPALQWTIRFASCLRPLTRVTVEKHPILPMILWGYEGSPFVTRVRETLCSMEIEYLYKTCGRISSVKRKEFKQKFNSMLSVGRTTTGLIQVPLLEDPNTGKVLLESYDIVDYLMKTYGGKPSTK